VLCVQHWRRHELDEFDPLLNWASDANALLMAEYSVEDVESRDEDELFCEVRWRVMQSLQFPLTWFVRPRQPRW
jgi:hypothetical protein